MDALSFMLSFYEDWPERRANPLYIAGGSYGGIYAPRLAYAIHSNNQELGLMDTTSHNINLKGFIVANGAIDYQYDPHVSALEMLLNFGIIPLKLYELYEANDC